MRVSSSRTPVKYWSSLPWSPAAEPTMHRPGLRDDEIEYRPLLVRRRSRLARRSPGGPLPKRRSKTSRGFVSGVMGEVGELHARLY